MNTVVFVLMMATGHTWIPTIEFNSEEKCKQAARAFYVELDERTVGSPATPWCMRIEK